MKIPEFYKRELYLDRIKPFVNTQMIKVLTGQRRVGKSFLIFQLMDYIRLSYPFSDFIYINKELFEFDGLKDYSDLVNYVTQKRNNLNDKCFLFIDEVQDITNFEKALRHFFAEGSSDSFTKFYKFGGLPYLINLPFNELLVSDYLRSIYDTIILKDVVNRYNIRNVRQLQDLTIYLADTIGNLFSANKISEYLKSQRVDLPPKTILEYLTYLNNAYFVKRLRPADIQGKRQFQIGEKYYFEDLGIRHAIRPFRPNDIGQVLENIVCHHLLVNGYNLSVGRDGDREIDFVGEKDGEKIYVQVAYSVMDPKTHEREFGNLLAIKDNYPKMVITMDELEGSSYEGIKQIPIRKFLREFK